MSDPRAPLRSFGRVKGRALKPRQAQLIDVLLHHLDIPEEGEIDPAELFAEWTSPSPVAGEGREGGRAASLQQRQAEGPAPPIPSPQGGGEEKLILEIGFGAGEHLVAQAAAHPGERFLGVEPFLNGVGQCLARIEDAGVANVRLHQGDARDVLARLTDASLDRVYILFPDPWPKTRHWKRRLIQRDFIGVLARVLKPEGEVRFATDWKHYAAWTLALFLKDPRFAWTAEGPADWREPWPGHTPTRYEEKRLGDTRPIYLRFRRLARTA